MKTYWDRLKETPKEHLEQMITRQQNEITIMQRSLATMKEALKEKTAGVPPAPVIPLIHTHKGHQ